MSRVKAFVSIISLCFGLITLVSAQGFTPSPASQWHDLFCVAEEVCKVGDVNGDGRADIIAFVRDEAGGEARGDVWVALSNGTQFTNTGRWHDLFCVGDEICDVADVNGDGMDDLIAFVHGGDDGRVWVALSNGAGFGVSTVWSNWFCVNDERCLTGDVNGDGRHDLVAMGGNMGNVNTWVALSTGTAFGEPSIWIESFCFNRSTCELADVNGDGMDDLMEILQSKEPVPADGGVSFDPGLIWVYLSNGSEFVWDDKWHDGFCTFNEAVCTTGDFNGDSKADVVMFLRDSEPNLIGFNQRQGRVDVAVSNGSRFGAYASQYDLFCIGLEVCATGDVDGDGKDDLIAFVRDTKAGDGRGDVWVVLSAVDTVLESDLVLIDPAVLATSTPEFVIIPSDPIVSFNVGDNVVVTEAGANLNLRTGPGTQFNVSAILSTNTLLRLEEGPVDAEGFVWWRVTTFDGSLTGWVVEGTDVERWLARVE